jgi:hypothetical protein
MKRTIHSGFAAGAEFTIEGSNSGTKPELQQHHLFLKRGQGTGDEDRMPERSLHETRASSELVGLRVGGGRV